MVQTIIRLYQSLCKFVFSKIDQIRYRCNDFVVVSNNCWGAEIYRRLGKPYNTPFVGLFIYGSDYIKLLNEFERYMTIEMQFTKHSKWLETPPAYPIGLLGDLEIHFMHYHSEDEAKVKWKRRTQRMKELSDYDKYFFKICDRDFTSKEILEKFHQLPFKNKISFGIESISEHNHIQIDATKEMNCVPDGVTLYKMSYKYVDLLKWVKTSLITNNLYTKIKVALKAN